MFYMENIFITYDLAGITTVFIIFMDVAPLSKPSWNVSVTNYKCLETEMKRSFSSKRIYDKIW